MTRSTYCARSRRRPDPAAQVRLRVRAGAADDLSWAAFGPGQLATHFTAVPAASPIAPCLVDLPLEFSQLGRDLGTLYLQLLEFLPLQVHRHVRDHGNQRQHRFCRNRPALVGSVDAS